MPCGTGARSSARCCSRGASRARVVARETDAKDIAGGFVVGWGASCHDYPSAPLHGLRARCVATSLAL